MAHGLIKIQTEHDQKQQNNNPNIFSNLWYSHNMLSTKVKCKYLYWQIIKRLTTSSVTLFKEKFVEFSKSFLSLIYYNDFPIPLLHRCNSAKNKVVIHYLKIIVWVNRISNWVNKNNSYGQLYAPIDHSLSKFIYILLMFKKWVVRL